MIRELRYSIVALLMFCSLLSAQATAPTDLQARLDAIVTKVVPGADEPGLAVLVVADGQPVLRKGYGIANTETGAKISPDMIFRTGSITKQFTAVAILQLVQAGKLKLDDPITKYVTDLDTRGQTITIEHLLTHTSGMPNYTAVPKFFGVRDQKYTPRQIVALVDDQPLDFEPGSHFKYSNTGYVLLGMVIEKASGQPCPDYMAEHVFKPAGLKDTRYGANDFPTDRHAHGYEASQDGYKVAEPLDMSQPFAAGAIESTVDDLWRWTQAVSEGKLVDPKLIERAWTPYTPSEGKSRYGYGWDISRERDVPGERWISHGGGINGFRSSAIFIPERKVFVVALTNAAGGVDVGQLTRKLALEALGRPVKKRTAIKLDEKTLDRYIGVYELTPNFKLTVTREGDRLFIQGSNQPNTEVFAEAEGKFFAKVVDAQFEFAVEGDHATAVTLFQNGREITGKRVE